MRYTDGNGNPINPWTYAAEPDERVDNFILNRWLDAGYKKINTPEAKEKSRRRGQLFENFLIAATVFITHLGDKPRKRR